MMIRINHRSKHFFVGVFCVALIGIIFIVGFLRYNKNVSNNAKTNLIEDNKNASSNKNESIDPIRSVETKVGIVPPPKSGGSRDRFDPVLDDNTPEENPNDVIEDPEME